MKYLVVLAIILPLMGAGCLVSKIKAPQRQTATTTQALPKGAVVIYVEDGCSRCAVVESKIKNGLVDKKIPITFKDTSDLDIAREMISKAQACGVLETNFGVPLLWDGQSCYVGQDKILDYIGQRMKAFN